MEKTMIIKNVQLSLFFTGKMLKTELIIVLQKL